MLLLHISSLYSFTTFIIYVVVAGLFSTVLLFLVINSTVQMRCKPSKQSAI